METLTVVFRKEGQNGITAVFPCEAASVLHPNVVGCYDAIGQHSQGDMSYFLKRTTPAAEKEYADLYSELRTIYEEGHYDEPVKLVVKKYFHSSMNQKRYKHWRQLNAQS